MGTWSPAAWGPLKTWKRSRKDEGWFQSYLKEHPQEKKPLIRIDCNDLTVTSLEWWLGMVRGNGLVWSIFRSVNYCHSDRFPALFPGHVWITGGWITIWSQSIQASPRVAAKHDESPHFLPANSIFFERKYSIMYLKILKVRSFPNLFEVTSHFVQIKSVKKMLYDSCR